MRVLVAGELRRAPASGVPFPITFVSHHYLCLPPPLSSVLAISSTWRDDSPNPPSINIWLLRKLTALLGYSILHILLGSSIAWVNESHTHPCSQFRIILSRVSVGSPRASFIWGMGEGGFFFNTTLLKKAVISRLFVMNVSWWEDDEWAVDVANCVAYVNFEKLRNENFSNSSIQLDCVFDSINHCEELLCMSTYFFLILFSYIVRVISCVEIPN